MQVQENIREEHVADAIYVYRNALSDELCDGIWNFYYENFESTEPGRTVGGNDPKIKKTRDFYNTDNLFPTAEVGQKYLELNDEVYRSLRVATRMYMEKYDWLQKCPNLMDTGYLWQGYKKGEGFYQEHIDGENWTPVSRERVLAIVIYINTVQEGGHTFFRHQGVSVKPEKGSVCIFPTHWSYPHQAMVPLSEDKLIISSFVVTPQN